MVWLIILLVLALAVVVGYRYYQYPTLSKVAKAQKKYYLERLQFSKELLYQIPPNKLLILRQILRKTYFQAGKDCFYGPGIIIYLKSQGAQLSIYLFSSSEDELTRYSWKIMKLKAQLGGRNNGSANG